MPRTVLRVMSVDVGGSSVAFDIDETPADIPDDAATAVIPLRPDEAVYQALSGCPRPGLVQAAGECLFRSLASDGRIRAALENVLEAPDADAYPIYFRIDNPVLASLPWEALYDARRTFLAIDDRWPIGRMPVSRRRDEEAERVIGKKLRVVAVIAAAGGTTDGAGQWTELREALRGTPCEVLVLTSEPEVLEAVQRESAPDLALSAAFVGSSAQDLLDQIGAFCPNLVHFYCHGTAEGRPELEVEKKEDREVGRSQGSIRLNETMLVPLCTSPSVWAVTLNCCEGARGSDRACSLANALSAKGVPVVVAMRESIHIEDAHRFAGVFYSALVKELERLFALHGFGQPIQVDDLLWGRALRAARAELRDPPINRLTDEELKARCQENPEGSAREWTYPVLYLNRGGLRLVPRNEPSLPAGEIAALQVKLDTFKQQREEWVRNRANPAAIAGLDTEIGRIERLLYPPFATPAGGADP